MPRTHSDLQPADVTCIVDSREQLPLQLEMRTIVGTLATGDYSFVGGEHMVCVERKSLQDLVMCVGRERDRFERELQRMRAYETRVIVIESSRAAVELKQYRGDVHPNAVLGSVYGWIARGITVEWAGDRVQAAKAVSRILFSAARDRWRQLQGLRDGLRLAPPKEEAAS